MSKNYHLKLKGFVGGYDFDKNYVDYTLDRYKDKDVSVLIDSLGGEVDTGLSISSAFRDHGRVSAHFRGMNASAATVASLGAMHITMDASAMYLAHKCSLPVLEWDMMNADELRSKAQEMLAKANNLDKIDLNIATLYANRCKKKPKDLLDLMKVGGWLTAREALDWGFIDEIVNDEEAEQPTLNRKTIAALNAAGIPLPDLPIDEEETFMQRLAALFHKSNNKTALNMKLSKLTEITGIRDFTANDGAVSLTAEQLQKVEDAIADRDRQLADSRSQMADLTAQINDLKKKPAADTRAVEPSASRGGREAEKSDVETYVETYNSAHELYNALG